jgi:hypothetical protein
MIIPDSPLIYQPLKKFSFTRMQFNYLEGISVETDDDCTVVGSYQNTPKSNDHDERRHKNSRIGQKEQRVHEFALCSQIEGLTIQIGN